MALNVSKRLPPSRARFYFSPVYLASAGAWKLHFSELISSILRDFELPWSFDNSGDWRIAVRFDEIEFQMCARTGAFSLTEIHEYSEGEDLDEWMDDGWGGPLARPDEFEAELYGCPIPRRLHPKVQLVARFVQELTYRMDADLRLALHSGLAKYAGRGNTFGQLEFLDLDQCQGISIDEPKFPVEEPGYAEDIEYPDARMRDGLVIYSFSVVACDSATSTSQKSPKKNDDLRQLYDPEIYQPILNEVVREVKRWTGHAKQAEAIRRYKAELQTRRLEVPSDSLLDTWVRKNFK